MTDQTMNSGGVVAAPRSDTRRWVPPLLALFLLVLLVPGSRDVFGGTTLSASRLLLLILFVPLTIAWLSGAGRRIILPDILIAALGVWILITYVYNHGMERVPYGIITGVELFGGYLLGRILIRSPADFMRFFVYMMVALTILLPFALYELSTSRAIMQEISQSVLGMSHGNVTDSPRAGTLWRVQSVFQHPILFGLFCSVAVANIFFIWRNSIARAFSGAGLALFMTFASLSSGPFLAAMTQLGLIAWGRITRNAWWTLTILFVSCYVFLEFASNRGMIIIIIETFTFNPRTAWWRVHIFNYGMENVWANPVFGLGLHDWVRPDWLAPTVDNFWLVLAMRHGIPGFLLLATAAALHIWWVIRAADLSERIDRFRTGYMIGFVGLVFALTTVHVWGPTFLLTMFYIGAGAWLYLDDHSEPRDAGSEPAAPAARGPLYRRAVPTTPRAAAAAPSGARQQNKAPSYRRPQQDETAR